MGAVITCFAALLAGYFYLARPVVIDADYMSPLATWRLWYDLSQGIDIRPYWEQAYLDGLASYHRWMIFTAVVAGLGVLVMASSLFMRTGPKKRPRQRPIPRRRAPGQPVGG